MGTIKEFEGDLKKYNKEFKDKQDEAIQVALDIRKFEIDLYWKRASYYWTFIAAAFAAYFLLQKANPTIFIMHYIVSTIGLVLSIAWYLANRGSKFWINNWETHVDYLENQKIGPLYKTVAGAKKFKFKKLLTAYPYSVAKINQVINLYMVAVWLLLSAHTLSSYFGLNQPFKHFNVLVISLLNCVFIVILFCYTKSNFEGRAEVSFTRKILEGEEYNIT